MKVIQHANGMVELPDGSGFCVLSMSTRNCPTDHSRDELRFTCPDCGVRYACYWDGNDCDCGTIHICMKCIENHKGH